jgi:hypothetical protein
MEQKSYVCRGGWGIGFEIGQRITQSTVQEFAALLDRSGLLEEDLQRFLTKHHEIVAAAFMRILGFVIPKFAFGDDHVSDFVVADWCQAWVLTLVELEPSDAKAFNKSGTPARRLASALKQLADWQGWIERHPSYFEEKMRKHHRAFLSDLKKTSSESDSTEWWPYHTYQWHRPYIRHAIVIGRRGPDFTKDQEDRHVLSRISSDTLRIYSYDWLVDIARFHAQSNAVDGDEE